MPKSLTYQKGSIVFFEGDRDEHIYILQSGMIVLKSTDLATGSQKVEQLHMGEFFGVKSALAKMPSMETATAAVDSVVVQMTVSEFEKIFSSKQAITLKMLRVFSKTLRDVHALTENYLNNKSVVIPPEQGLPIVANAFYAAEQFVSCLDVLGRLEKLAPQAVDREDVKKLRADAEFHLKNQRSSSSISQSDESVGAVVNQFSLPVFDRFTKTYKPGEVIISEYEPGETFYLIKSGEVQIVKCISDQNKNLDILKSGAFFGEMAILDNSQRSASCVARTNVSCLEFNKENFNALVLSNPQIVMQLLKLLSKRVYDQYRQFKIILIKEIPVRVADVFLMYDELNFSVQTSREDNFKRSFMITVNDVASWAAISQDVAREELSRLNDRHKIELFQDHIVVRNIHDFKRTVDSYYKKNEE